MGRQAATTPPPPRYSTLSTTTSTSKSHRHSTLINTNNYTCLHPHPAPRPSFSHPSHYLTSFPAFPNPAAPILPSPTSLSITASSCYTPTRLSHLHSVSCYELTTGRR
ncbi:hypothetical protein E2C01_081212 [Portunus trituberculatus]|uniref:Uncharacterized protein n=1 Tax=Portunus trituberculatus TaxID=210409 RepID=A0A5B7IY28_PORTR|nr:hypothetical protein [Portunus trituberculatus]